jgi:hypothetical protein
MNQSMVTKEDGNPLSASLEANSGSDARERPHPAPVAARNQISTVAISKQGSNRFHELTGCQYSGESTKHHLFDRILLATVL